MFYFRQIRKTTRGKMSQLCKWTSGDTLLLF